MNFFAKLYRVYFSKLIADIELNMERPEIYQNRLLANLMGTLSKTTFGKEHGIESSSNYLHYRERVPLRGYEEYEPYIRRVREGESSLLWSSPIKWFAKSSGTSNAVSKFIPVTKEALYNCHYHGMKQMIASYLINNPTSKLLKGNALTLGGSVVPDTMGREGQKSGDLSAILLSNTPPWVELRRVPSKKIALMSSFEEKVEHICKNARSYNVTNFSGVPSWNLVLLRQILQYNGEEDLHRIWPNLELFMHGGISFKPYRKEYLKMVSGKLNFLESYNASEGFFAFQNDPSDSSMLLLTNNGIFYEFIPLDKLEMAIAGNFTDFDTIESVTTNQIYAPLLTTNGGLWRYLIGDTVEFTSLKPHKIIITGRTQLYINAFGEELMIHNAEKALTYVCNHLALSVATFTVAPHYMSSNHKGYHQWLIEFDTPPQDLKLFAQMLDNQLQEHNSDYRAKRENNLTILPLAFPEG
ncbi:MAG: GH3 auxin-responsive promoter family protein [Bacteroidales bacterium]